LPIPDDTQEASPRERRLGGQREISSVHGSSSVSSMQRVPHRTNGARSDFFLSTAGRHAVPAASVAGTSWPRCTPLPVAPRFPPARARDAPPLPLLAVYHLAPPS